VPEFLDVPDARLISVESCKQDFPIFDQYPDLHYLDSAATTQKPRCVIEAIASSYATTCAPVHRGLYDLAAKASEHYERARQSIADFIQAPDAAQVIFTRSATESINLIACGWARPRLVGGDEIWVSEMEHHANFLPWQRICNETGATLRLIPVSASGELLLSDVAEDIANGRGKLIAVSHVSNVLGCINPIETVAKLAKQCEIPLLIDASQSVGHIPVDVQGLDCAFMVFSSHKMYGPDGIGVLYGKQEFLEQCEPLQLGGGMVDTVGLNNSRWAALPEKLEAGSPNLAGAVGLAAAAEYIAAIGLDTAHHHAATLAASARHRLSEIPGVRVFGTTDDAARQSVGIVSFDVADIHPHDVAQIAAEHQVALRAGHHCCQPLMRAMNITGTLRASYGLYNDSSDTDALIEAVRQAQTVFARSP